MRFLTHNSLRCHLKGLKTDEPFDIEIKDMDIEESECNIDFIKQLLPSLDWKGVIIAAKSIELEGMPEVLDPNLAEDEAFLEMLHYLLLDVHVITGNLICTETGRKFPIEEGIPMLM